MTTQRDASRAEWQGDKTREGINSGSLQRIADACEKMCLDREKLERDYRRMRNSRDYWQSEYESAMRRVNALRGVITKLKRKPK